MPGIFRKNLLVTLLCTTSACAVGPDYVRPSAEQPAVFKELTGWKQAQPQDALAHGKWWELFEDPELNALEEQVAISNQNIKVAEAQYREARALVAQARAGFFPTLDASASQRRSGSGNGSSGIAAVSSGTTNGTTVNSGSAISSGNTTNNTVSGNSGTVIPLSGGGIRTSYDASLDASWEPDIWGRVRRLVEANEATAQASNADLEAARLSAQAQVALDYMQLRIDDAQAQLLARTVADYQRSVDLTLNQYKVGVAARADVVQAQTQLQTTQAQALDVGVQRAQMEHAIAILLGKAPADFSIAVSDRVPPVPDIPLTVPSTLLERRPDIAAAERQTAAANAQIGVAEAAFYPDITLSASGGFDSSGFAHWLTVPNRIWSLGPSLAETFFDGGLRSAQSEQAIATYDQYVATYRQTVLGGFQEVEDNLAALRIYDQEAVAQHAAVASSEQSVQLTTNQYRAGIVTYLNVITVQTTALANERTELTLRGERLTAAVTLIRALGGGWDATALAQEPVLMPVPEDKEKQPGWWTHVLSFP